MDKERFRTLGYQIVDWVADYLEKVDQLPVVPAVAPGEIKQKLPPSPPAKPEDWADILRDFNQTILPGITHWQHPGWFAYFPANNSPASILGEILTAGIGAQCMSWQTSPAATELEEVVIEWLRQMIGLPEDMTGVIQDTASTATLCALIAARERATGFESNRRGFDQPLTVYASREAHSSVEKGVKLAGYGREKLRFIPTDENYALLPEELEAKILEDIRDGAIPACVVATIGTTSSAAIDPLRPIGEICSRHGIWLHVDAAYAGTAAILPEMRWMLDGSEYVDSFVFNPHKWMLTNFDCSAFFVRDSENYVRAFEMHPEYLKTAEDRQVKNFRDWGIQLGRRFRALKLWFVIRSYGVEGLQAMVREHIRLAQVFRSWLEANPLFEVLAPSPLSLVCFRMNDGRPEDQLNLLNRQLHQKINASRRIFLTHTELRGRYTLRLVVGQRTTGESHVRLAWEIIKAEAEQLVGRR
ncbi:MAG: pyridoxal phosphate-dependent decarboxylase family protein [Candidatus Aminicenantales bacterium]